MAASARRYGGTLRDEAREVSDEGMTEAEGEMTSFERKGVISLWLFRESENPANEGSDVLRDFAGVDYYDPDSTEGVVRDALTPIDDLLSPLSYSQSFRAEALAAANRMEFAEAYGVLAQYDFAYDPTAITRPIARDPVFLGTFLWHD